MLKMFRLFTVKMGSSNDKFSTEHQNLRLYLKSRLMFPPFLVEKYPKVGRTYEFPSSLQLVAQTLWTLRYDYFLTNTEDDLLNYYLVDVRGMHIAGWPRFT